LTTSLRGAPLDLDLEGSLDLDLVVRTQVRVELVNGGEVADLDLLRPHKRPVARGSLKVLFALEAPVVLAQGLVVLDARPPPEREAVEVVAEEPAWLLCRRGGAGGRGRGMEDISEQPPSPREEEVANPN
jgi:hypothetical protein